MWATAAPARAASIGRVSDLLRCHRDELAAADGVPGSGDRAGDENLPVHAALRSICELTLHILQWTYHNSAASDGAKCPHALARPRRSPRRRAGVRAGRDAAGRPRVRRDGGVPGRRVAQCGCARAHVLRPPGRVRRRRGRESSRPLRGGRRARLGRLADLLGGRTGRLLRGAVARAGLRRAEAALAAAALQCRAACLRASRSPNPTTGPTLRRSRRPPCIATAATS